METEEKMKTKEAAADEESLHKIITIPNILSFLRLCMIPWFVWLYCWQKNYPMTAVVLLLSGLTDVADGFIARHFHMVSNFGKALDPVADKLTQFCMLVCLLTRDEFRLIIIPVVLIVIKEIATGISSLIVIKKTGEVMCADWHGKVTTFMLYAMMIIHVLWYNIPFAWSTVLILACVWMMLLSFVMYIIRNVNALKKHKESCNAEK